MNISLSTRPFNFTLSSRKPKPDQSKIEWSPAQTREGYQTPNFSSFNAEIPYRHSIGLINALRANLPIIDAIPIKFNRLIGDFEFETYGNEALKRKLEEFKYSVKVNYFGNGFDDFQYQMFDSAIAKGMGFGELVPTVMLNDVHRLKIAAAENFAFLKKEDGGLTIGQRKSQFAMQAEPLENLDYIYYMALDQRDGHPQGYSIFHSMSFIAQILTRVFKSFDNAVWRVGDPSYAFSVEGGNEATDKEVGAAASALQIQWAEVCKLKRSGQTGDIFGALPKGSKLKIDIIGKDAGIISRMEFPIKTIIEEIISKTPFPGWMFGAHWATRQTLAKHENDMIVSSINANRRQFDPIIDRIFTTYLILTGDAGAKWTHNWSDVNLLDETEKAKARLYNAQAWRKEIESVVEMLTMGLFQTIEEANEVLLAQGLIKRPLKEDWIIQKSMELKAARMVRMLNA